VRLYLVKSGGEYLTSSKHGDIWSSRQSKAYRFVSLEQAGHCAHAWKNGAGSRTDVRVVFLVVAGKAIT